MVVNEALESGVLSRDLAEHLKSTLKGLRWFIFKAWLPLNKHALLRRIAMDRSTQERGLGLQVVKRKAQGQGTPRLPLVMMTSHRLRYSSLLCFVFSFSKAAL